ncbi:MAG: tRNA uridine-5-carboxymethylaminomethyl(34) synthesis GTPase MnmE [Muribaculaceae bacterium]|nr:tRNA uridine-5-carboxymethylaminomethyl(34) synthesis GTPase MnmE [Muribaculaceae bacterium]
MTHYLNNDTICAISTPQGTGGIAVVRVSGSESLQAVARRWKGADLTDMPTHTAHLGKITFADGQILDEVVLTVYRAPHSFTGEDVVEISCHGSVWIQQQLINTLIDAGCRLAMPGEFTRRAFANGHMDLSQAEAVADLIASHSAASHRVAMNQMRGRFSGELQQLRDQLLRFVSLIELELDFSEEDVTFADRGELTTLATEIHSVVNRLAQSFHAGNAIKNGVPVAIVGATNAGKSSLLNALLGDERALVSDIHGTTRDVIEDTITIEGTLFRFIDTAGIRQSDDTIEQMGIERSYTKMEQAQIVLWVVDNTAPVDTNQHYALLIESHCQGKQLIAVFNKADVAAAPKLTLPDGVRTISISAHKEADVDRLRQLIVQVAALPTVDDNAVIVTNARHYQALMRADEAIGRVIDGLRQGLSGDLLSQDIRECLHHLGTITGQITTDAVLGEIFAHFCVGK